MSKKSNSLEKNSIIVFILTTFGSAINYACQIFMGKYLTINNYGSINTIFSLVLIFSIVGTTGFMILSKKLPNSGQNGYNIYQTILNYSNKSSLIILILCILGFYGLKCMIDGDFICIVLSILCFITGIYQVLYQGVFGGTNNFMYLGLYTLITPILKLMSVVPLILFKTDGFVQLYYVLIFLLIGNLISMLIGHKFAKKILKEEQKKNHNNISFVKEYVDIFFLNILMMLIMNFDILYLSISLGSEQVGLYSSVLVFGKMIYYFATALITVMLPMISKQSDNKLYAKKMLDKTLFYTIILTVLLLIPLNIFGKSILTLLFGNKYLNALPYLKYASLIPLGYSINSILMNYAVGIGEANFIKKTFVLNLMLCTLILCLIGQYKYISLTLICCSYLLLFVVNYCNIKGIIKVSRCGSEKKSC